MVTSSDDSRAREQWTVEVYGHGSWHYELNGPHVSYDTAAEAEDWAVKLKGIHPRVRIMHTITDYIEV